MAATFSLNLKKGSDVWWDGNDFNIPNVPDATGFKLTVIDFKGEESVFRPHGYKLHIVLYWAGQVSANIPSLNSIVDGFIQNIYSSEISFTYSNDDNLSGVTLESKTILGYASGISLLKRVSGMREGNYAVFELEISSFVNLLTDNTRTRLFKNMTLGQIIEEVVGGYSNAFNLGSDYVDSSNVQEYIDTLMINYVFQYAETDLNFLNRLLYVNNMYYYVANRGGNEQLVLCKFDYKPDLSGQIDDIKVGSNVTESNTDSYRYIASYQSTPNPKEIEVKANNLDYSEQEQTSDVRELVWNDINDTVPGEISASLIDLNGIGKIVVEDDFFNSIIFANPEVDKLDRLKKVALSNNIRIVSENEKINYLNNHKLANIFDVYSLSSAVADGIGRSENCIVTMLEAQGGILENRIVRGRWDAIDIPVFFSDVDMLSISGNANIGFRWRLKPYSDDQSKLQGFMPSPIHDNVKTTGIILGYINAKTPIDLKDWQNPVISSYNDGTYDVMLQGFEIVASDGSTVSKLKKISYDSNTGNVNSDVKDYTEIDSSFCLRLGTKVDFMSTSKSPNFGMNFPLYNGAQVFIEFSGKNLATPHISGTTNYNIFRYYPSAIDRALEDKISDSGELARIGFEIGFLSLSHLYLSASLFSRLKEVQKNSKDPIKDILQGVAELFPFDISNASDIAQINVILSDLGIDDSTKLQTFIDNGNSATIVGQATASQIVDFLKYIQSYDAVYKNDVTYTLEGNETITIPSDGTLTLKDVLMNDYTPPNTNVSTGISNLDWLVACFEKRDITNIVDPSTDNDQSNDKHTWFSRGFTTINPEFAMSSKGGQKLAFSNVREGTSVSLRSSFIELNLSEDLLPKPTEPTAKARVMANNAVVYTGGSGSTNYIKKEAYNVYQKIALGGSSENWLDYETEQFPGELRNILGFLEPVANTVLETYFAFPSDPHKYMFDIDASYKMSSGTDLTVKQYDWSGDYLLQRHIAERYHYVDGNSYTWRFRNDIYRKGPRSTSYFPGRYNTDGSQDISLSTLEGVDASLAMLIDINGSFSAHRVLSEKFYVDEHKMVAGDQGTIITGKYNTDIYGSHTIKTGYGGAYTYIGGGVDMKMVNSLMV